MKNLVALLASAGCLLASSGCIQGAASHPELESDVEARRCDVGALAGANAIRAVEGGVVFSKAGSSGDTVLVRRAVGAGCELEDAGGPSIAAGELLDADDLGNVYAFPAEATGGDTISTMLPDEYPGSMVARIDAHGAVSKLLPAGRGIWGFGVTARGDALWVSACGPNGLYDVVTSGQDAGTAQPASWAPGDTLWEQYSSAITDRDTFWSVGVRKSGPPFTSGAGAPGAAGDAITPASGFALTRSTRDGSVEVGATVVDFGDGFVQTTLARCGSRACGFAPAGVVVWDREGAPVRTLDLDDLGAETTEHVADVTASSGGLYVMLSGGPASRVVFLPEESARTL